MSWNEVIYGIGDFFWWAFGGLEALGNNFNGFLIVVGAIMIAWWISRLIKFSGEANENGTIE